MAVSIFEFCLVRKNALQGLNVKIRNIISAMARASFGVYLIHPLVMALCGDVMSNNGVMIQMIAGAVLYFTLSLDETENTLTARNGQPLQLNLPLGKERSLVFNIGPEEGKVEIQANKDSREINLYRQVSNDNGEKFSLPYVRFSDPLKRNFAALMFAVLLICIMAAWNIRCRALRHADREAAVDGRVGAIELLRFNIALCVVVHHYCGLTPGGYLGVDFFFLLSGYLLMRHNKTHERRKYRLPLQRSGIQNNAICV